MSTPFSKAQQLLLEEVSDRDIFLKEGVERVFHGLLNGREWLRAASLNGNEIAVHMLLDEGDDVNGDDALQAASYMGVRTVDLSRAHDGKHQ